MNWLQIRLFGPYFSSFSTNSYGYYSQMSQNLSTNDQIFASALIVRQTASPDDYSSEADDPARPLCFSPESTPTLPLKYHTGYSSGVLNRLHPIDPTASYPAGRKSIG
jgi:hypothetical protein